MEGILLDIYRIFWYLCHVTLDEAKEKLKKAQEVAVKESAKALVEALNLVT